MKVTYYALMTIVINFVIFLCITRITHYNDLFHGHDKISQHFSQHLKCQVVNPILCYNKIK